MTTAYITHPRYNEHDLRGHPEHAGRIEAVWQQLQEANLINRMKAITASPISEDLILKVHTSEHLSTLQWVAQQDKIVMIDNDTYALQTSYEVARLSAGGVINAVDAILKGDADNAMAVVRPPGHHATPFRPMGFCLLSNIALGARHALDAYGLERVMIVDYDVHHGNGTQDVFYEDNQVLFISTHQSPFYPGTGDIKEIGKGAGEGYTVNVPLSGGYGDTSYHAIFQEVIWALAERYQPQLILVSAGFDAHWVDPLAHMKLSLSGYDHFSRELIRMAEQICNGNIVFVMEGGYDLQALSHGWRNIAHALLDDDELSDPYGNAKHADNDIQSVIQEVKSIHQL